MSTVNVSVLIKGSLSCSVLFCIITIIYLVIFNQLFLKYFIGPRGGAPPPPVRSTNSSAPPPPYRGAQPPLPPSRFAGGRPAPPQCTPSRTAVKPPNAAPPPPPPVSSSRPPPPPGAGIPPPPPPPPPPAVGAAPPAPPPPPPSTPFAPSGAVTDGRSNLLDAIRAGKTLHSVETSSGESIGDERDQLLKQIQSGSKLKKVNIV